MCCGNYVAVLKMKNFLKILLSGLVTAIVIFVIYKSVMGKADKDYLKNVSWVEVTLPYSFKNHEAENLSVKAFNLKKAGHFHQAINFYLQAIQIEPDNPKLYFDISDCYARKNRLKDAIINLNSAINLDSTYPALYNNRGLYYYQLYEDEKAISDFKKAIHLDNKIPSLYYNLSISYYSAKRLDEACKAFRQAKKLGLDIDNIKDQKEFKSLRELCN